MDSGLFLPAGAEDPDKDKNTAAMEANMARGTIVSVGPSALITLYRRRENEGFSNAQDYEGDLVLFATGAAGPLGGGLWLLHAPHIIARIETGPKDL